MSEGVLFEFTVPDELLREAVTRLPDPEAVAEIGVIPGTGEGKPPPLLGILRSSGYAPLVLLTVAAIVPSTFGAGINLIGNNLEKSFHLSDAGLGAVAFVASVSQFLWAVPLALWADRGSRKMVAAVALLIFCVFGTLMGLSPNIWWFVFLYLLASLGVSVNQTVHNSFLADAYPTEGRSRVFSWHYLADPIAQTVGILIFGSIVTYTHDWRWGLVVAGAGVPIALSLFSLHEPDKGANESSHILKASGMDTHAQQQSAPRVLLGSAVTRLLRIRSLYYQLVAVAVLGFVGISSALFGNLYFVRVWHQSTAHRSVINSIIGLAAFLGLPVAYTVGDRLFRRAPQAPLLLAGVCIAVYGALYSVSLYMPNLWLVVLLQFLANAAVAPIAICHLPDPGGHGPGRDAVHLFRHVRRLRGHPGRIRRAGSFSGPSVTPPTSPPPSPSSAPSASWAASCWPSAPATCAGTSPWSSRTSSSAMPRARDASRAGRSPLSRSTTSTSSTGPSRFSSTSTSRWPKARSWPSSGPTAPVRAPCSGPSRASTIPTGGSSASRGPTAPTSSPSRSSTRVWPSWWEGR